MKWNECRRTRKSLSLYVGGALSADEKAAVEPHLQECAECRNHLEQLKTVTASLTNLRTTVSQLEPSASAQARWSRDIKAIAKQGADKNFEPRSWWMGWWEELVRPYRYAWGGMTAVWLAMWLVNWGQPGIHGTSNANSSAAPVMAGTFQEEQQMLAELFPAMIPQPAEPPRQKPAPRSERQRAWVMA